jgi:hypothetical protein
MLQVFKDKEEVLLGEKEMWRKGDKAPTRRALLLPLLGDAAGCVVLALDNSVLVFGSCWTCMSCCPCDVLSSFGCKN